MKQKHLMKKLGKIMRNSSKLKAYTFIEVLISMVILSSLFFLLIQTILTLYKSNQFVSTLNSVTLQVTNAEHILDRLLISTDPKSVECNIGNIDLNGDGNQDDQLVKFKTVFNNVEYLLVYEHDVVIPYRINATYNRLALYKLNPTTNAYEMFLVLTDPAVSFNNITADCSPVTEDKLQSVYFTTVTLRGSVDSLATYLFIPNMADVPIVKEYPFYKTSLIIN